MENAKERRGAAVVWMLVAVALAAALALGGCSTGGEEAAQADGDEAAQAVQEGDEAAAQADDLRIVSLKGPTSIGLAYMMQQEQGSFEVVASGEEAGPALLQGDADIACVPANLAAALYRKTDGQIRVIDVNTLGVLYAVTGDESVDSLSALEGRTVYLTGKGTVPEYTVRALLAESGLEDGDVTLEFKSEPAEVAAVLAKDPQAVAILPQPYVTAVCAKVPDVRVAVDLTQAWNEAFGADGGSIVTGVTVAKASTIEERPEAVATFLARHADAAAVANDDAASIAATVVDAGIIDDENVAVKAIPQCNVVCLTGEDMKTALSGYLGALYEQDPSSVGGALPDDGFYYLGD